MEMEKEYEATTPVTAPSVLALLALLTGLSVLLALAVAGIFALSTAMG